MLGLPAFLKVKSIRGSSLFKLVYLRPMIKPQQNFAKSAELHTEKLVGLLNYVLGYKYQLEQNGDRLYLSDGKNHLKFSLLILPTFVQVSIPNPACISWIDATAFYRLIEEMTAWSSDLK